MPPIKNTLFRTRNTTPTVTARDPLQHQAPLLHLPELLELTLSFLSDHHLRLTAQVCRQWRTIAMKLLDKKVDWTLARANNEEENNSNWTHPPDTPEHWARLSWGRYWKVHTHNDTIQYPAVPRYEFHPESWNALTGTLENITRNSQAGMELELACLLDLQTNLLPLLSIVGSNLASLTVDQVLRRPIALESVLALCPRLWHLSIAFCWPFLITDDETALLDNEQELPLALSSSSLSPQAQVSSLVLRSLTLSSVLVRRSALLRVLRRCPELQELRLSCFETVPAIPSTLSSSFGRPSAVNTMQFFESIAESCPRLQSLQFSKAFGTEPNNRAHGIEYHWRIAALFPSATRWTFQVNDLLKMQTFNQKHLLGSEHANLTTLVIEGPLLEARHAEERLNVFLTSSTSSAHKLIHLQVTGLAFPIWWWDLELRQGHSYPLSKQKEPLRNSFFCADIWRCRSLKTLHVRVRDKDELHFGRTSMRIICGYVSKVFPELEDLVLEKTLMDFDMDSGLCLLTRLSRLKKLSVVALAYGRVVSGCLDWLAKDWPRTSRAKKQLLNEWRLLRPRYVEETFAHAPFRSAQDSKPGCSVRDYMVDGVDMRHVGQVRDIVEAVKERLSDGGMCWPWLEFLQLRIGADVQQRQESLVLEAKVREMRPEIELEVIRRRLQS